MKAAEALAASGAEAVEGVTAGAGASGGFEAVVVGERGGALAAGGAEAVAEGGGVFAGAGALGGFEAVVVGERRSVGRWRDRGGRRRRGRELDRRVQGGRQRGGGALAAGGAEAVVEGGGVSRRSSIGGLRRLSEEVGGALAAGRPQRSPRARTSEQELEPQAGSRRSSRRRRGSVGRRRGRGGHRRRRRLSRSWSLGRVRGGRRRRRRRSVGRRRGRGGRGRRRRRSSSLWRGRRRRFGLGRQSYYYFQHIAHAVGYSHGVGDGECGFIFPPQCRQCGVGSFNDALQFCAFDNESVIQFVVKDIKRDTIKYVGVVGCLACLVITVSYAAA